MDSHKSSFHTSTFWRSSLLATLSSLAAFALQAQEAELGVQRESLLLEPEFSDAMHGQSDRLYLDGFWKFKPEINSLERKKGARQITEKDAATKNKLVDNGARDGYFKSSFNDSSWDEIPVPMPWQIALNTKVQAENDRTPFAGAGYYRKTFEMPASKEGLRAILHFASVQTECKVWVNGVLAGEHVNATEDAGPSWAFSSKLLLDDFSIEVTKLMKFGERNVLVLRVADNGLPILYGRWQNDGGICGPVRIDLVNQIYMDKIFAAADPLSGVVRIEASVDNAGSSPAVMDLTAELTPFESKFYTPPVKAPSFKVDLGRKNVSPGANKISLSFTVDHPVPWDVDKPFLYRLRILDKSSAVIGQTRIGFRKFEVSGQNFLLNGHPLYLRGTNMEPVWEGDQRILMFNKANWAREDMKLLKKSNINLVRVHNGPNAEIFYDICDELGFLTQDDYSPDTSPLAEGQGRAEMIATVNLDRHINADGSPNKAELDTIKKWLELLHNHPSVCMFTAGNELGFSIGKVNKEAQLATYLNCFYDLVKANDLQRRPVTPSSGLTVWQWHSPVKADYYDYHNYANGNLGWADCGGENWNSRNHFKRIYGSIEKPVINGECGAYIPGGLLRPDLTALFLDGQLIKSDYVRWANKASSDSKLATYHDYLARSYFAAFAGIRSVASKESLSDAAAKLHFSYIEVMRRDMPFLEGFALQAFDPARLGMDKSLFLTERAVAESAMKCSQTLEFTAPMNALSPLTAIPDMHDRHCFAGDAFSTKIFLLNDQYATPEPSLTVKATIEDADGKVRSSSDIAFTDVPECGHLEKPLSIPIPAETRAGDYQLHLRLIKGDTIVHESSYPLMIQPKSVISKQIACSIRVAYYDQWGQGSKVLDSFGIPYKQIASFDSLNQFDILIIGPDSLTADLTGEGGKIRAWLEDGGRALCLEQSCKGPIPFAAELSIQPSGPMPFADVIEVSHPIIAGLKPWHFELWNGERHKVDEYWNAKSKAVYSSFILPMQDGVALSGASRGAGWVESPKFGMVAGEVKIGKGLVFFSQTLAASRLNSDPVAAIYLSNLFEYVLGDAWTGERASPLNGKKATQDNNGLKGI